MLPKEDILWPHPDSYLAMLVLSTSNRHTVAFISASGILLRPLTHPIGHSCQERVICSSSQR